MKHIVGVSYRHPLTRAYINVAGETEAAVSSIVAEVSSFLQSELPDAIVLHSRRKSGTTMLPVIIAGCERRARAVIAALVLRDGVG